MAKAEIPKAVQSYLLLDEYRKASKDAIIAGWNGNPIGNGNNSIFNPQPAAPLAPNVGNILQNYKKVLNNVDNGAIKTDNTIIQNNRPANKSPEIGNIKQNYVDILNDINNKKNLDTLKGKKPTPTPQAPAPAPAPQAPASQMTTTKAVKILRDNIAVADVADETSARNNTVKKADLEAIVESPKYSKDLKDSAQYLLSNPTVIDTIDNQYAKELNPDGQIGIQDLDAYIKNNPEPGILTNLLKAENMAMASKMMPHKMCAGASMIDGKMYGIFLRGGEKNGYNFDFDPAKLQGKSPQEIESLINSGDIVVHFREIKNKKGALGSLSFNITNTEDVNKILTNQSIKEINSTPPSTPAPPLTPAPQVVAEKPKSNGIVDFVKKLFGKK